MFVFLSVYMSICSYISTTTCINFTKFSVHINCDFGNCVGVYFSVLMPSRTPHLQKLILKSQWFTSRLIWS